MNMRKKLLLCLAAGFVLTILSARVAGSSLVSKIMPITLPQQSSEINGNDVVSACPSSLMAIEEYGFPLLVYEHIEESDGCGAVFSSPARIFPVAIVLDVLFWTAAVFGGTVLVARLQNRPLHASSAAKPSQMRNAVSAPPKPVNVTALYIFFGGVLGLGFCLSFALFAATFITYQKTFLTPLGAGDVLRGLIDSPSTWIMLIVAGLLTVLLLLKNHLNVTAKARFSVVLPLGIALGLQLLFLIQTLLRTQQSVGSSIFAAWLVGWGWSFMVYLCWAIVMIVLAIRHALLAK
jgi:hypothetical protein